MGWEDLPGPAQRLFDLLAGQADADGRCELPEAWVAQKMGCSAGRLRSYRGNLARAGLLTARRKGAMLAVQVQRAAQAPEPQHPLWAADAPQLTLDAGEDVEAGAPVLLLVACPCCGHIFAPALRAEHRPTTITATLTFGAEGRLTAVAPVAEARESARKRARDCTPEPVLIVQSRGESRDRARAFDHDGSVGGSLNHQELINYPPTPQTPRDNGARDARDCARNQERAVAVAEAGPAVQWAVAAANPDYDRNRDLLEDGELGIGNRENVDLLARGYAFDDLLAQVFAYVRERERNGLGPGALVYRLRSHLADPRRFWAGPPTREDRLTDLYRRHCVLIVEDSAEGPVDAVDAVDAGQALEWDGWEACRRALGLQLPQVSGTTAVLEGERLTVFAETERAREWLAVRGVRLIAQTVASAAGRPLDVGFEVRHG